MLSSKASGTISSFCALPPGQRNAARMKKFKPHTVDWAQIDRFLASAEKKLSSAQKILAFDEEACLQQAYEAMLKASLGFMFSYGFRARSQPGHHIAIIEFVRARIDKKHASLLT